MSAKKYTTADQRKILAMAGIEHIPGRSFEEAESLIEENMKRGTLPPDTRDRASIRQLSLPDKIGVKYPENISAADASRLIDEHTAPTEKQIDFLRGLGADIPPGLTKQSASELIDEYTQIRPMSDGQAQYIAELGGVVDRSMTYKNAGEFIEYLFYEHNLSCVRCGARLDRQSERCACGAFAPRVPPVQPPSNLLSPRACGSEQQPTIVARLLNWLGFR